MHYNCKSVSFDHLHPVPLSPHPHFWWPQIVFLWASLFACLIFKYNWPTTLWYFLVYNTVIQYFYIAKKDCSAKFSYHLYHSKMLQIIDYIPHAIHFTPMTQLFCNWEFVPLILPHYFISPLTFTLLASTYLFSVLVDALSERSFLWTIHNYYKEIWWS